MSLSYRQENQLRRVEADFRRSDPHLGAMFGMFAKLYPDQDMPASEQVPPVTTSQDRLHRAAAWIVAIAGCRIGGITASYAPLAGGPYEAPLCRDAAAGARTTRRF